MNTDKTVVKIKSKVATDKSIPSFECSFSVDNSIMTNEQATRDLFNQFTAYKPAWFMV